MFVCSFHIISRSIAPRFSFGSAVSLIWVFCLEEPFVCTRFLLCVQTNNTFIRLSNHISSSSSKSLSSFFGIDIFRGVVVHSHWVSEMFIAFKSLFTVRFQRPYSSMNCRCYFFLVAFRIICSLIFMISL